MPENEADPTQPTSQPDLDALDTPPHLPKEQGTIFYVGYRRIENSGVELPDQGPMTSAYLLSLPEEARRDIIHAIANALGVPVHCLTEAQANELDEKLRQKGLGRPGTDFLSNTHEHSPRSPQTPKKKRHNRYH
ncbi:hypothetical protein A2Z00_01855 [Candidatus Gottesmanbacteria bacterium RBG_13_45_10]|uniref:Uncharacterized protein n=1 Tax=Candidatus Gottesmanbacteria bacterium RBG_13_45_10 TaxID=1798370 RepID=A0A1F5ZI41_9BACT|nr:MAG: hypothetical protein A2Z00_01855 [Candidatus Gottesmanbacteria bacterium RBG_13_45_10]